MKDNPLYNQLQIFYDKHGHLGSTEQNILTRAVIDYFVSRNIKLDNNYFKNLATQIAHLFPNEAEDIYFEKSKHQRAKGKLYYRYTNVSKQSQKEATKLTSARRVIEKRISFLGNGIYVLNYYYVIGIANIIF